MEDIYGQRGNGMGRYAQHNNPAFNNNQFNNYNQQQQAPQEAYDPYNQQNPQQNFYSQQQVGKLSNKASLKAIYSKTER